MGRRNKLNLIGGLGATMGKVMGVMEWERNTGRDDSNRKAFRFGMET